MDNPQRNLPDSDVETTADSFSDFGSLFGGRSDEDNSENLVHPLYRRGDITLVEEPTSRGMEDVHPNIQGLIRQAQNLPRRSEALHFRLSSNDEIYETGISSFDRYVHEPMSRILRRTRGPDLGLDEEVLTDRPSDERMEHIANQLLLLNVANNSRDENLAVVNILPPYEISDQYCQLYNERNPLSYDFAMNLMAYIEFLNDSSWNKTVSFFDINLKKMFKTIWEQNYDNFNNAIDLQTLNTEMILKLMLDFTKWSINREFHIKEFLNYCVLICQLAVVARKRIFKEAPLYAIGQLRDRIKVLKFENLVQYIFEKVINEYAQRY